MYEFISNYINNPQNWKEKGIGDAIKYILIIICGFIALMGILLITWKLRKVYVARKKAQQLKSELDKQNEIQNQQNDNTQVNDQPNQVQNAPRQLQQNAPSHNNSNNILQHNEERNRIDEVNSERNLNGQLPIVVNVQHQFPDGNQPGGIVFGLPFFQFFRHEFQRQRQRNHNYVASVLDARTVLMKFDDETSNQNTDRQNEDAPVCSICLQEYKKDQKVRKIIKCTHQFHPQCIEQWIREKEQNPTCPLCKINIDEQ